MTTRKVFVMVATTLWFIAVGIGMSLLSVYEFSAGPLATPPSYWPASSQLPHQLGRPTLVMLAHPQCSCTRASLEELSVLMTQVQGQVDAAVVFLTPTTLAGSWAQTDLWRSAAAIPGVQVIADQDGAEARLFQSVTSGQIVVYDAQGRLAFRGGITSSRGHVGENVGRDTLSALVRTGKSERTETPVFGCPLF